MNAIYQDFGKVGDKKRLGKVINKVFGELLELFEDENERDPHSSMQQLECSINGFCRLIITWSGDIAGDDEDMLPIRISINASTRPTWFELFEIKYKMLLGYHGRVDEVCDMLIEKLSEFGNLRAVKVCPICTNHPITNSVGIFCEACEMKVCHHDEVCPICMDKEDTDNIWIETECKHIFHSACINKYILLERADKKSHNGKVPCPMCRTEISPFHKIL